MTEIAPPPAGDTVVAGTQLRTFLVADIRGYTRFTQQNGAGAAARLVARFATVMRAVVPEHGGSVVEIVGDESLAVFATSRQALESAVALQDSFAAATAADPSLPLAVGIGLDAGEAAPLEGGFRGDAVNLASRLCNLAGPGDILASEGVVWLGRDTANVTYAERGSVPLKGFVDPVRVIRVIAQGGPNGSVVRTAAKRSRPRDMLPIGSFLGALPAGALVGREDEWQQIVSVLEDVAGGAGRLLLLFGEPGVGKTRLAQEVTVKAQHWGFEVATGRCYEQEQSVPYFPFLEALAALFGACTPDMQVDARRRWPQLGRLLPEQMGLPSSELLPGVEREEQQRLFRAVAQFLENVAQRHPVAILLDDLHWADESSLKLLHFLARYAPSSRILLLATYRDVEVNRLHPLETTLADLGREGLLRELEVGRLSPEGTRALMTEIMGSGEDIEELVDLIQRRTAGNAFFVQEMLRALVERGDVYRRDGRWEARKVKMMEIPKSIRSVIGQRLSRLDLADQDVLRLASVLGQRFSFDDLLGLVALAPRAADERDIARTSEEDIDATLTRAAASGLVREVSHESYTFNHALTQETLYSELSARRRKRLHLAAGEAIEQLPPGIRSRRAPELALHFLEADDAERALAYSLLAGDQAEAVFAHGEAERHYHHALEMAREREDPRAEMTAQEKLAGVLVIQARYERALELLEDAARLARELGDSDREASLVAQIGNASLLADMGDRGIDRLAALAETLDRRPASSTPSHGVAELWSVLARLRINALDRSLAGETAQRAVELARAVADERLIASAEITWADALWQSGHQDEAIHILGDVVRQSEGRDDLDNLARALYNMGTYYARKGDLEHDRIFHQRSLKISQKRGDRGQILMAAMLLSQNAFLVGNWAEAESQLERAEEAIESLGSSQLALWPLLARGWLALRRGDFESASRYAEEADGMTEGADYDWCRLRDRLQAEIAFARGDVAGATSRMDRAMTFPGWDDDLAFLASLALVRLASGDGAGATAHATRAVELARGSRSRSRLDLPAALIAAGIVASEQGQTERAIELLEEARTVAANTRIPFEEARALAAHGEVLLCSGRPTEAAARLAAARTIFERVGAAGEAARVDGMLGRS